MSAEQNTEPAAKSGAAASGGSLDHEMEGIERSLVELKKEVPVRLVVIDSSFISYRDAGQGVLSHAWVTWLFQPLAQVLLSDRWAPEKRVAELAPTPLVVMHGNRDQVIDYDLGEDLFKAAGEPKEFWRVEGGRHIDAFWRHSWKLSQSPPGPGGGDAHP